MQAKESNNVARFWGHGAHEKSKITLSFSSPSLLNTVMSLSKLGKRPLYATTTQSSETTLWKVDVVGNISPVAQIYWSSAAGLSRGSTRIAAKEYPIIDLEGQQSTLDQLLMKSSSGLFNPGSSRCFSAGDKRYKWKKAPYESPVTFTALALTCYEIPSGSSSRSRSSRPSTSSGPFSPDSHKPIAEFFPPCSAWLKPELSIYKHGEDILDHLVLTALLMAADKEEWRNSDATGAASREVLETRLRAEAQSSLPPYQRHPPTASRRVRVNRPHTSDASLVAPPPYA